MPALVEMLKDEHQGKKQETRHFALEVLQELRPTDADSLSALIETFKHDYRNRGHNSDLRPHMTAFDLLQKAVGTADPVIVAPLLVKILDDEYQQKLPIRNKRVYALRWLTEIEPKVDAKLLVPPTVRMLKDKSHGVRLAALNLLRQLGPRATEAVPALNKSLADEDEAIRKAALNALRSITKIQNPPRR